LEFLYLSKILNNENHTYQVKMQFLLDNIGYVALLKVEIKHAERASVTYCVDEKTGRYETLPIFIKE